MQSQFIMCQNVLSGRLSSGNRRKVAVHYLVVLFFFLSAPCSLLAQQNNENGLILFRGAVIDAVTRKPVEGVCYSSACQLVTGANGLFSFYARANDTVTFKREGYRKTLFFISDTLKASEYTMGIYMNPDTLYISEIVILPRLENLKASILMNPPSQSTEQVNAINNLRISAYQGKVRIDKLGDADANYEFIKQRQKIDAFERGGIPSDKMVGFSPFTVLPLIIHLMKGSPEVPPPPEPYLSSKELNELNELSRSLTKEKK